MDLFFENFWTGILLLLTTYILFYYYKWITRYNYWKDRNVPYLKPQFPFGNIKGLILQKQFIGCVFKEIYDELKGHKYGGIFRLKQPMLTVKDPELIKQILVKDFKYFSERGQNVENSDLLSANSLFTLRGNKWNWVRTKLTPTFTSGKIKMMFQLINACAIKFTESLSVHAKNNNVIEVKKFLASFLTDVIGSCAFGLDIDSINQPDNDFRKMTHRVLELKIDRIIKIIILQVFPRITKFIKIRLQDKETEEFFMKIIKDTIEYRKKNNIKRNDFLDLLIQLKNTGTVENESTLDNNYEDKKNIINTNTVIEKEHTSPSSQNFVLTEELMTAQCFIFFVAGFETSSSTLSFCLYELALNKPLQIKLQQEIDSVLNKHNGKITYESLVEMKYMDKVIQETLRKYPPASFIERKCVTNYFNEKANLKIEEGTPIGIPVLGIHHDPEYYPDPDYFDPERFTEEAKQSRPHYTWLAFGEGPRSCIGMRFALIQVKTGLATLLSEYSFDQAPETQVPLQYDVTTFLATPKDGVKLRISTRGKIL